MKSVTGTYYYLSGIGTPGIVAVIDSTGKIKNRYRYNPWGGLEDSVETVSNVLKFAGREYDPETHLYYNRARYYDPQLARFISEDPIGQNGGSNQYAYAADNPVGATDASGECDSNDTYLPEEDGTGCASGPSGGGPPTQAWSCTVDANWNLTCTPNQALADLANQLADLGVTCSDGSCPTLSTDGCSNFGALCGMLQNVIGLLTSTPDRACSTLGSLAANQLSNGLMILVPNRKKYDAQTILPSGILKFLETPIVLLEAQDFNTIGRLYLDVAHEEAHVQGALDDDPETRSIANPAQAIALGCQRRLNSEIGGMMNGTEDDFGRPIP